MITIVTKPEEKSEYNQYILDFKTKISKYSKRGSAFNKKEQKILYPFTDDTTGQTKAFFQWLLGDGLQELTNASPLELEGMISLVEKKYPLILDNDSVLYKNIYHTFVDIGYKEFPKGAFINSVGADCCPYCNRVYVYAVKGKTKTVKGEIDHFYTKKKYPYLALSFFNLIPSCSFCNGSSGKHTIDSFHEKLINPYEIRDDEIRFTFDIKNVRSYYSNKKDAIIIKLITSERLSINDETFHLSDLYSTHGDHVLDLIFKSQIKYPMLYRQFLGVSTKDLNLTKSEVDRLIVGNYTDKKDFHKRPLSKLYHDIAKELGLID